MIRKVTLLAAAGSLVLAGCGAGVNAGSTQPTRLTEGVNYSQGGIDALNVFVLGPKPGETAQPGTDLPVYGSLINNGSDSADALKTVSVAPGSGGNPIATAGLIQGGSLALPPHQLVQLAGTTSPLVVLKGITAPLRGGEHIKLTLAFQTAETITLDVPVIPAQGSYATLSPAPTTTPKPTGSPTTKPTAGATPDTATPPSTATPSPSDTPTATAATAPKKKKKVKKA